MYQYLFLDKEEKTTKDNMPITRTRLYNVLHKYVCVLVRTYFRRRQDIYNKKIIIHYSVERDPLIYSISLRALIRIRRL